MENCQIVQNLTISATITPHIKIAPGALELWLGFHLTADSRGYTQIKKYRERVLSVSIRVHPWLKIRCVSCV
jgi:hypothetical protein